MVQKGSDKMPEVDAIRAQLFALQDKEYQIFYSRLMPTLPPETVIGVRVPLLRKLAKQLTDTPGSGGISARTAAFFIMKKTPSMLFCWSLSGITARALAATERFLPMWITGQSATASAPRSLRNISRNCCVLSGAGWALTKCIPCATGSGC